jgi:acyl-CoA thioester hydrolase
MPGFTHRIPIRYLEVDQQGVVFNMWYLAYADDAMTEYLAQGGLPYIELNEAGYDVQLVHTELDWVGSLGWPDRAEAAVDVTLTKMGTTSFTLQFDFRSGARPVARATTVYVVVDTERWEKCPVPEVLRDALGPVDAAAR